MSKLCYGCMLEIDDSANTCPHCGFKFSTVQSLPFLPFGYTLKNRYIIGTVLKTDVQGIEYLGYDTVMKSKILITEFMPEKLCGRTNAKNDLVIIKSAYLQNYKDLLYKFLKHFRTIAMLRNLNCIPNIYDIFTENNTAYIIEEAYDVIPFTEFMTKNKNILDWNTTRPLFTPLINAVDELHNNSIFHFGISPKSLFVTDKGKLLLRDFIIPELRQTNQTYSYKLIPGCSAPEQYSDEQKLGPDTDVYGFTATLFFALTGKLPDTYEKRRVDSRLLINTNIVKNIPPHVISTLANGLQLEREKRLKAFKDLYSNLTSIPTIKAIKSHNNIKKATESKDDIVVKKSTPPVFYGIISFILSLAIFAGIGLAVFNSTDLNKLFNNNVDTTTSSEDTVSNPVNLNELIKVPNLSKYNYKELIENPDTQKNFNIIFNIEQVFSSEVPQECILSQYPEAGKEVPKGTAIIVTVSKGAKLRELPDIKGKSLDQAAQLLAHDMFIATAKTEYHKEIPENCVIGYEAYKKGDKLDLGSKIVIIVSKGKDPKQNQ